MHHRNAFVRLAHDKRCRSGDLVGDGNLRHLHRPAEQIGLPHLVDERGDTGRTERDADHAIAPRPAKRVADDDTETDAERTVQLSFQLHAGRIGILGKQEHALAIRRIPEIRAIDARIGHNEAGAMRDDDNAFAVANNLG